MHVCRTTTLLYPLSSINEWMLLWICFYSSLSKRLCHAPWVTNNLAQVETPPSMVSLRSDRLWTEWFRFEPCNTNSFFVLCRDGYTHCAFPLTWQCRFWWISVNATTSIIFVWVCANRISETAVLHLFVCLSSLFWWRLLLLLLFFWYICFFVLVFYFP